MPRPRKLKSGADAHDFTEADRRKGAQRTNAKPRDRRETAEREAREQLAGAVNPRRC